MAKTLARKKSTAKPAQAQKLAQPKKTAAAAKGAGKYVYLFGKKTDGNGTMKPLLGGKGANLAEMCRIGLPVPPGFTITTEVCTWYYANGRTYPADLVEQMETALTGIESRAPERTDTSSGSFRSPNFLPVCCSSDAMPRSISWRSVGG